MAVASTYVCSEKTMVVYICTHSDMISMTISGHLEVLLSTRTRSMALHSASTYRFLIMQNRDKTLRIIDPMLDCR